MKIGVTGATGQLGRLVVEELKKRVSADAIIALVRTPRKAADLGVESREFDYNKPDGLADALTGIDRLLLISSNEIGQRVGQHANVVAAAKKAGVKWVVYTSLLHADTSSLSLAEEHRATERLLKESGIPHTLLRNGWYTENYTNSIPGAIAAGAFIGSAGNGKIASAARADYAEAVAVVLVDQENQQKIFELAGDDAYTLDDLAAEVSRQIGKVVPYQNLSEVDYANALKNVGLPDALASAIAGWDVSASRDDLFDNGQQLSKLIGRATTPLSDTVATALASLQSSPR
jgi:Predicted nucleoside-diphosphate-sugar epimerases